MTNKPSLKIKIKNKFDKDEKNLIIISTLFQLLSALEAQKYFNLKNLTLVLLFYGNQNKDESQLKEKIHLLKYDKCIILDKGNATSYINLNISLINEIRKYKYNRVFVGFFSANLRRIFVNIIYKTLYLLDDGVYSISIHNEIYNEKKEVNYTKYITPFSEKKRKDIPRKIKFFIYDKMRKFYFFLHGYQTDFKEIRINFFTMFNLEKYQDEEIIVHNFSALKKLYQIDKEDKKENKIYFLGQPLDRASELNNQSYINCVWKIFQKHKSENKKFIYIPHRAENPDIIKDLEKLSNDNFRILKINQAFELYALENKININTLISFHSTALVSIKKLFPFAHIESYRIPIKNNVTANTIDLILKQFEKEGIAIHYIGDL